jgi:hypothetical protein
MVLLAVFGCLIMLALIAGNTMLTNMEAWLIHGTVVEWILNFLTTAWLWIVWIVGGLLILVGVISGIIERHGKR